MSSSPAKSAVVATSILIVVLQFKGAHAYFHRDIFIIIFLMISDLLYHTAKYDNVRRKPMFDVSTALCPWLALALLACQL